jgi:hypothetical protein
MPWLGRDEGYQSFRDGTGLFEGTISANRRQKKSWKMSVSQKCTNPGHLVVQGDYILYRGDQYLPLNYCSRPNIQKYVINSRAPRINSQARERCQSKECRENPKKS